MNDQQLHRKQIVMLVLATVLAIGSLWIPLPQQAAQQTSKSVFSEPGGRFAPIDSMTFAREPATASRFSVMASIPPTAIPADSIIQDKAGKDDGRPGQPSSLKLNSHDLANGDKIRSGNPPLAPIKDYDRALGR
jgi:hypothetical protein